MATVRRRKWKSPNGEFKLTWGVDYDDLQGTRRWKGGFDLKKDADAFLSRTKEELRKRTHTAPGNTTVAAALDIWLQHLRSLLAIGKIKSGTLKARIVHAKKHIVPFLGPVKLSDLEEKDIDIYRASLREKGRSEGVVVEVMLSLELALDLMRSMKVVGRNVVRDRRHNQKPHERRAERRPKRPKLQAGIHFPTVKEVADILAAARGRYYPVIVTAAYTALRLGELRGLRWVDVDLDARELHVMQSADDDGKLGPPKTEAANRRVPLSEDVVAALRVWRAECPESVLGLVFPNKLGGPLDKAVIYHALTKAQEAAGLVMPVRGKTNYKNPYTERYHRRPKYPPHKFRHFGASMFIRNTGWDHKKIQTVMGHTSVSMTYDLYGHMFPSREEDQMGMAKYQAKIREAAGGVQLRAESISEPCGICGELFVPMSGHAQYCSEPCKRESNRRAVRRYRAKKSPLPAEQGDLLL